MSSGSSIARVVAFAAHGSLCTACVVANAESDRGPAVVVHAFSIAPTTIGVDETFTVGWDIERSGAAGYATIFGLYVGGHELLDSEDARSARKIFDRGAGGVTLSLRDTGSLDCVYLGPTSFNCPPLRRSTEPVGGLTRLTLRACEGNVVPPYDEVCDWRETDAEFAVP
jgi:hypothetical protein